MSWCTIESDPGVFSELISSLGVKDVSVEEIYSLEQEEQQRELSYGLIFLFKWREEFDTRQVLDPHQVPDLFFARQVVQNACATQAILSVLLNAEGLSLGDQLDEFKAFSSMLDSETRGEAIGSSDMIRVTHNSFARPEPFISEEVKAQRGDKEDVYHFIAYLPFRGSVYEIDGLKSGPVVLGEFDHDWLAVARPAIEARMNRYASSETHFALLSIRQKRATILANEVSLLESRLVALSLEPSSSEEAEQVRNQLFQIRSELEDEIANQERQRVENVRRRHNYVPFIMVLLKALAKKGALQPMITNAITKANTQRANRK